MVIDTSVLVAGFKSRKGASFRVLKLVGSPKFELSISVPLVLEYESALKRMAPSFGLKGADVDDVLDYVCTVAEHRRIHFLWRPFLRDPEDDMLLELAVESGAGFILTHNLADFAGSDQFGVRAISPAEFLHEIGVVT